MWTITSRRDMASESNWSSFLNFIEDLLNECENHMSGEDYRIIRLKVYSNAFMLPAMDVKE